MENNHICGRKTLFVTQVLIEHQMISNYPFSSYCWVSIKWEPIFWWKEIPIFGSFLYGTKVSKSIVNNSCRNLCVCFSNKYFGLTRTACFWKLWMYINNWWSFLLRVIKWKKLMNVMLFFDIMGMVFFVFCTLLLTNIFILDNLWKI